MSMTTCSRNSEAPIWSLVVHREGVSMPYGLLAYAQQALTVDELRTLVGEVGLAVGNSAGGTGASWTIVCGARARYSFTRGTPAALEPKDVPEEVTAVLLAPAGVPGGNAR